MKTLSSKKKIIISILALVIALVVATGSTYAWFTMGNTVTLDDFQVGVTTETDNLYVAAGTINTADGAGDAYADMKAISKTAIAPYAIGDNTYKITLSTDTINDILIHQYGAMVSGLDGNDKVKNYPLIAFTETLANQVFLAGTGTAQDGVTYYSDAAANTAVNPSPSNTTDVSKYYVKATVTKGAADASYFYYFNEATHAPVVITRTGTGTSTSKFEYRNSENTVIKVYPNTAFDAITTVDGKNFETINGTEVAIVDDDDHMANYTEFNVYFRSTANAYDIKLDSTSEVTAIGTLAAKITAWAAIAENEYSTNEDYNDAVAVGGDILARAANAVRISFTNEAGETFIWNPNADTGYNNGNLADDYWALVNGGEKASVAYADSYADFTARDFGNAFYIPSTDTEVVATKTYYTDNGYTKATVTAADYKIGKFYTITEAAATGNAVAGTKYYTKAGDNYTLVTEVGATVPENSFTLTVTPATGDFSDTAAYYTLATVAVPAVGSLSEYLEMAQIDTVVAYDADHATDSTVLTTLAYNGGFYEANLTVRVWIEGWDGDCFDDILSDFFQTTLSFSGIEA